VQQALLHLLTQKRLLKMDRLVATVEAIELSGRQMLGSRLVARAWMNDDFKARLLRDGNAAASEIGISATNPNAPTQLRVVANDASTHNLVVCTLCSCYPAALLGPFPAWYKSRSYRARAVRAPRALLQEAFGLELPAGVALQVHDSTADLRYLVLPERPEGTQGMGEAELAKMVGRDAMIGVARV
jgi:nitrile hydratase